MDQAVGHEHIVLGIGDMVKMYPFIALLNPWGDQEQDFQCTFLCRVDGRIQWKQIFFFFFISAIYIAEYLNRPLNVQ